MSAYSREAVEQLSESQDEPAWMREFRLNAWEIYQGMAAPTIQDEPWRRTDLRRLELEEIGPSLNGNGSGAGAPAYMGEQLTKDKTGGILVQVDGETTRYELGEELSRQGVIFCDMQTAVRDHSELVRQYFMSEVVPVAGREVCCSTWRLLARWYFFVRTQRY